MNTPNLFNMIRLLLNGLANGVATGSRRPLILVLVMISWGSELPATDT